MDSITGRPQSGGSPTLALVGLSLAVLMPSLATSSANVALPALAEDLGSSFAEAQWIILSYLLTITAVVVGAGRLGDAIGRRTVLLVGIAVFSTASLLCFVAPTLVLLVAARVAQGVGAAIMMALAATFVVDVIPKERVGAAVGLLGTMSAIGTMLGPALGGALVGWAGARSIFLVNVPLGGLGLWLAYRTLPTDTLSALHGSARFDVAGLGLLALALTTYALGLTPADGEFEILNGALLLTAVLATASFVFTQRRAAEPLVQLAVLQDMGLAAGLVSNTLVSTVMMATLVVGPFYLAGTLSLAPVEAGLVLSAGPLVAALVGVPAGKLVDHIGAIRASTAGLVNMLAGAGQLWLLPETIGIVGYIVASATLTAGYALFQAANTTAVVSGASSGQRGVVSGLLSLSRNFGLITGASAMGAVFALSVGTTEILNAGPKLVAEGMRSTFGVAVALILVALAVSLHRTRSSCGAKAMPAQ